MVGLFLFKNQQGKLVFLANYNQGINTLFYKNPCKCDNLSIKKKIQDFIVKCQESLTHPPIAVNNISNNAMGTHY